jgi:hypothetical protein
VVLVCIKVHICANDTISGVEFLEDLANAWCRSVLDRGPMGWYASVLPGVAAWLKLVPGS